jgi:hypothetical protein
MQTAHFARFASLPTRIGGIALGLMVAAGSFAIAGSTRGSGAIDDTDPRTGHAADAARSGEAGAWDLQESAPAAPAAIKPRQWPRCPECGVVESVRRTQVSVGADGQAIALDGSAAFAHGSASESAFDANDGAAKCTKSGPSATARDDVHHGNPAHLAAGKPGQRDRRLGQVEPVTGPLPIPPWHRSSRRIRAYHGLPLLFRPQPARATASPFAAEEP